MKRILLIPYISVHNANALSSPYTIGFPAMTAWLGAMHALQRHVNQNGFKTVTFTSMAVICHALTVQNYKGSGDYIHSIIGTSNPLGKDGKRSSFIEEGRCHLTVSLVIEYNGLDKDEEAQFLEKLTILWHANMKLAGGDILKFKAPELLNVDNEQDRQKLIRKLMPGYALIERRDLMIKAMQTGQDAIDALLDYLKIMHRSEQEENGSVVWTSKRKSLGWIVPIATGFHGITSLEQAKNQRDPSVLHRFAESVVTLGEFKMAHHIKNLDDMLWHTCVENDLYLCQQNNNRAVN